MARFGSLSGSTRIQTISIPPGTLEEQRHTGNTVSDFNGIYTVIMWHGGRTTEL
jgi:hypothetical protein